MSGSVTALLVSPHLIDLILIFVGVEAVLLRCLHLSRTLRAARTGVVHGTGGTDRDIDAPRSTAARRFAVGAMLLPGICLLLAVRAALADAAWPWLPAALTAALVAHLLDLRQRLRDWSRLS